MTYSSPSRSMCVVMLVASEEATSGSVIANAERISPAEQRLQPLLASAASSPNWASTSMLPVSGAAQLVAVGAELGDCGR
ncbi:hypothetical protein STENM223S_02414 [Streptomyces tendae]